MPSYHRGSGKLEEIRIDEFEEAVGRVLELYRTGERDLWEAAKKVLPGAGPPAWRRVAKEAFRRLEAEGVGA
jgi:hypothetical protein